MSTSASREQQSMACCCSALFCSEEELHQIFLFEMLIFVSLSIVGDDQAREGDGVSSKRERVTRKEGGEGDDGIICGFS